MIDPSQTVLLTNAKELFGALLKLKTGVGNSTRTICDLFTANGNLVVKTNTGDFKGKAEGELWPPVKLSMLRVKQLATIYGKSEAPVRFERNGRFFKVDGTTFSLKERK